MINFSRSGWIGTTFDADLVFSSFTFKTFLHSSLKEPHRVTDLDFTGLEDFRSDSSMAAHGVVAPGSEVFFHPVAGGKDAGGLQNNLTDLKRLMFEGKEVDSGNDQVTPDPSGIDFWFTEDVGNHLQVFLLNQGDLTFSGNTSAETVSLQS